MGEAGARAAADGAKKEAASTARDKYAVAVAAARAEKYAARETTLAKKYAERVARLEDRGELLKGDSQEKMKENDKKYDFSAINESIPPSTSQEECARRRGFSPKIRFPPRRPFTLNGCVTTTPPTKDIAETKFKSLTKPRANLLCLLLHTPSSLPLSPPRPLLMLPRTPPACANEQTLLWIPPAPQCPPARLLR